MSGNRVTVISERKVSKNGATVYHDTIERKPSEVIQVFNPYEVKNKTKHIKLQNNLNQKEEIAKLSRDEKVLVFCLSYYLDWETNIIVGDDNVGVKGFPLRASEIDAISGLDRKKRVKAMQGLIDKNILAYIDTAGRRKAYVMNPDWALNGRNPQEALLNTFRAKNDVDFLQELGGNEPIPVQELGEN